MNIKREDVFKIIARCRMVLNTKEQLAEFIEENDIDEDNIEYETYEFISDLYKGTSNGYLSEIYEAITGEKVEVLGEVTRLYKCPCCGRNTLSEIYDESEGTGYDICDFCNWEDDGTIQIDVISSVNKGSIADYRKKIELNKNLYYREKWFST